jgi:hypothetical protein
LDSQLVILKDRGGFEPPFPNSVFTTAEFTFGNSAMHVRSDLDDVIHGFRAITVLGTDTNCICVIPADNMGFPCPPGTTFLISGLAKGYLFTTVAKGAKRYLFQQFFHGGIQNWMDHGFRSDSQFLADATPQEMDEVAAKLANRVPFAMKLFSRLDELHT